MKAKKLAEILLLHPESDVVFYTTDDNTDGVNGMRIEAENIYISPFIGDEEGLEIAIADSFLVEIMKREDYRYADIMTKPRGK